MEALSFSIPVIASDVGGTNELLIDGYNGFLLRRFDDVLEVTNKIHEFLSMDKNEYKVMRENAYKSWDKDWNAEKLYNNFAKELKIMNNSFRLVFIIFTFLLFLLGLFNDNLHILFWSVMLQFIHNFWYSLINIYNRIIFLCFNVSIFIFLFGRLFVSYFFGYKSDISGILGTNFMKLL